MIIHGSLASKDFDQAAVVRYGISTTHLMEIAGKVCAEEIEKDFKETSKKILIISGPGNNGGDSFVVARFLISYGWNVSVILINSLESYQGTSLENLKIIDQMSKDLVLGLQITFLQTTETFCILMNEFNPDVIVDALFGVGLMRSIKGLESELINIINKSMIPIYSIDMPSGISADTGQIKGIAIKATKTITFETMKYGHLLYPGREYSGKVIVKNIGFPISLKRNISQGYTYLKPQELKQILKIRPVNSYKGMFGKAYIYGGSKRYQGALQLALLSCLKSGVGLVYAIYKDSLSEILTSRIPAEVIHETIPLNQIGEIDQIQFIDLIKSIPIGKTSLGVGPGLGRDTDAVNSIKSIYQEWKGSLVIDADGLYAIKNLLKKPEHLSQLILTPHLAEMSYLTELSIEKIESDLVSIVKEYAEKWDCTLVLKSASTIIANPVGKVFINQFGNSGMAKGGSGDVLTGIITSLLAQGYGTWEASVLGVNLHSLAGDFAAKLKGIQSMLPTDICNSIPNIFQVINQ